MNSGLKSDLSYSFVNNCQIRTSFYAQSYGCLICQNNWYATINRTCVEKCPTGYIYNAFNICVPIPTPIPLPCPLPIPTPTPNINFYWIFISVNNTHYQLWPSSVNMLININIA